MGTCLLYLHRYEEAKSFLEQAITLRETYQVLMDGLPKFKQKLKECCEHLKSIETNVLNELTKLMSKSEESAATADACVPGKESNPPKLKEKPKLAHN